MTSSRRECLFLSSPLWDAVDWRQHHGHNPDVQEPVPAQLLIPKVGAELWAVNLSPVSHVSESHTKSACQYNSDNTGLLVHHASQQSGLLAKSLR